ncbi:hypothetical protein BU15DRAFT_72961 [Melanogaster broomeanus]|nr:hypothetical protein BU15DRAFT_72961 [Melanogaster broomeanus]
MPLTADSIRLQEDQCILPSFDSNVAWELGNIIRTNCKQRFPWPAVIYIAHANSNQMLFFATSGPGTLPDNMHWVKRKEAVVLRWGVSTMRMELAIKEPGKSAQQSLKDRFEIADPSIYGCHGGGFPVKVKGVEGVVGVIVVSGVAKQDESWHAVIVEGIQEYLAKRS